MNKRISILAAFAVLVSVCSARAADDAKEKTVTGVAKCAKCALKESDECQNVIEVKEGNKKTTYYLAQNDVSKGFHKNVCQGPKDVKATISVSKEDGKEVYTAKKIEEAKQ